MCRNRRVAHKYTMRDVVLCAPMATPDDREAAIDGLFQGPQAAFIGARNALALVLRANRDADGAAHVKALAKPSISAWALNQLWWHHHEPFQALLRAGEHIRATALAGAGPAQQAAAGKARRQALTELGQRAQRLLLEAGHAAANATMRKLMTSLEAAAAYGRQVTDPPLGRRSTDLAAPGFESMAALGGVLPLPSGGASTATGSRTPTSTQDAASTEDAAANGPDTTPPSAAQRRVTQAHSALSEAQSQASTAARNIDELTRLADAHGEALAEASSADQDAQAALRQAQHAAERTEAQLRHAQTQARETDTALKQGQAASRAAGDAVTAAQAALAKAHKGNA